MAETSFNPFATTIEASGPSTEPQREIWTATRLSDEASLAFNESVSLHLRGPLRVDALRIALFDVLARHDALRATFSDDGLSFLVAAAEPVDLAEHDWSSLSESEFQAHLDALLERVVNVPFSLETGPLIRFELVRRSDDFHILVISAHHIICDGWSTGVIVTELAALYNEHLNGGEPMAPAETFVEYAEQQTLGSTTDIVADQQYWLNRFSGELPVLELPTDRPRPALRTYNAEREDVVLPASLIAAVRKATGKEGSSLFAGMLAGFGALLQRLTQQDDIVVGVPVAGQATGHQTLVGHAVNMVPIRMQFAETTSFSDLVRSVRSSMLDAQDHQHLSFGGLLQLLPIPRDPSRSPLVSVIFNFDKGVTPAMMPFDGVTATMHSTPRTFENFELFVNAVDLDGEVTLEVQYNTGLFDRETIRRWCALYRRLLELISAEDMKTELRALPLLSDADRAQIGAAQGFVQELPAKPLVHLLIDEQCRATPDGVAVEFEGNAITYRELGERANKLAEHLVAAGVAPGMPVGLCVERSIDMIVAQQAILRAGGAYLPLDPDYPADRLAFMIEDSRMAVVVAQESTAGQIPAGANVVLVDKDAAAINARSASFKPVEVDPNSPCYIIYTSGSTGKPKGVLNPHIAVVNLLLSVQKVPGLKQSDRMLAITTLSFDIAVSELILPLTVGARIVLASREIATDGVRLKNLIASAGVTFIDATPATYRLLFAADWAGDPKLTVICTGEAMPKDIAVALVDKVGKVWNGYGPTETTVWSTFYEVTKPVTRILIGKPVANTQVYVLDALRQPVPFGVRGELYIGGIGVALGYLHRPDLTEQRFLPDPFSDRPGARMYKTGDVVRLLQNGDLDYLGRNDNQVKLRGFRIELGEIEDALLHHPSVKQAAVIVREDRPGDKRLVGYISVEGDKVADAELRAHVKKTLPDYMTPQAFVTMPTLPLTPSGKIDRKGLPAPDMNAGATGADFVAPRTETEKIVAELWGESLGIGRMSVVDDFFALGGHSLLASQVLARLRRDYGVNLPFRKIFEAPTVEQFARLVEEKQKSEPAAQEQQPIPKRPHADWAPLSVMQERLWLLEEMEPRQRAVHNLGVSWRLRGPLKPAVLEEAMQRFVDRHAIMRTGVDVVDGVPRQAIAQNVKMALTHVDMSDLPKAQQDRDILEFMHNEERVPFDLAVPPLMRAWLIKVSDDEHVFFSIRHNLIWDGWSFDLFIKEVAEFYAAKIENREPKLAAPGLEYADFAAWQREWNKSPEMAAQTEFWRKQLANMPEALEVATDRPRPPKPTFEGDRVDVDIDASEVQALANLAREQGSTLFMILFSAFSLVLQRWSDQNDIIVGTPMRARTRPEMEDVIGPFVNTLGIRLKLNPDAPFTDMLRDVRDVTLESFGHQEMPFELLGSRPPVIRALFSLQDAKARPTQMGDLRVLQMHTPGRTATNDLMLWTMERNDGMLLALNYSADIFDRVTAERFLAQFHAALLSIVRDPSKRVSEIDVLPASERAIVTEGATDLGGGDASSVAADFAKALQIGATDVVAVLGVADPGLDKQLATIGARMVTVDNTSDDEALARAITDQGVTILIAPESRWRSLVGAGWTGGSRFTAVVVDAPVASASLEWLRSAVGRLFTVYSDDALGGWLSLADITADVNGIQLGRPLGGARFFVLNSAGHLAPIGVTGRLHVGGVDATQGDVYETVARDFVPGDARLYASHDRVRRTSSGKFELVEADASRPWLDGRRVQLDAVERGIAKHPTVAQAASVVRRDPSGRVRHVAYVVWKQGEFGDVNDLRFDLKKTLSPWLVPHLVVEVDEMPRAGGAVDRRSLPWPFESRKPDFVPPSTDAEKLLAKAWADALGLERVSAHENFFDLGGYSLLAFRMIDALAAQHGVRVNPRLLLLGTLQQAAAQMETGAPAAVPVEERQQDQGGGMFSRLRGIISGSR